MGLDLEKCRNHRATQRVLLHIPEEDCTESTMERLYIIKYIKVNQAQLKHL